MSQEQYFPNRIVEYVACWLEKGFVIQLHKKSNFQGSEATLKNFLNWWYFFVKRIIIFIGARSAIKH